jgi:hypothetical protein
VLVSHLPVAEIELQGRCKIEIWECQSDASGEFNMSRTSCCTVSNDPWRTGEHCPLVPIPEFKGAATEQPKGAISSRTCPMHRENLTE